MRYRFFDENALLTGLVKREYVNSGHLSKLTKQYRNTPWLVVVHVDVPLLGCYYHQH